MMNEAMTLQDAASELDVGVKTLKRWLDLAGIEPTPDPRDRRKRLVSRSDMDHLKEMYGILSTASPDRGDIEQRLEAMSAQIRSLEASVASLSSWLSAISQNITLLTQQAVEQRQSQETIKESQDATQKILDSFANSLSSVFGSVPNFKDFPASKAR